MPFQGVGLQGLLDLKGDTTSKPTYISATIDPILMMSPLRRFAMKGTTAFAVRRAANVFVSKIFLTRSRDKSTRGPTMWHDNESTTSFAKTDLLMPMTPALFTTMSILPSASRIVLMTRSTSLSLVTSKASFSMDGFLKAPIVAILRDVA